MLDLTQDAFFQGRLSVNQTRQGYRFSIDAVLLATSIAPKSDETILDLGTGCGIIALILAFRYPGIHVGAVEIQSELASLAQKNICDNRLHERITVACADMRMLPNHEFQAPYDWVVSNPPYHRCNSGRINANTQRALARHEIMLDLDQLLMCAQRMLRMGGRFATIYPAERIVDLFNRMRQFGLEPKWMQAVQSQCTEEARLVLVQGLKDGRPGLHMAAPLVVYEPDGTYTPAVQAMMEP